MDGLTIGEASAQTGWSARMLRYVERTGLVQPTRSGGGYRLYGQREVGQLRSLDELRRRFRVGLDDVAFALRLRREPDLRAAVDTWLDVREAAADTRTPPAWVAWEQVKHERLLAA